MVNDSIKEALDVTPSAGPGKQYPASSGLVQSTEFLLRPTTLINDFSQKMKTEINALVGFSQLLEPVDVEQKCILDMIGRQGNDIISFIEAAIDWWQIETNTYPVKVKSFRLQSLLDAIKAAVELKYHARGTHLEITCDSSIPLNLKTDPRLMRRALTHLFNELVARSESRGIQLHLTCPTPTCLRWDTRGFVLPRSVLQQGNYLNWSWSQFDFPGDLSRLYRALACKRIALLGGQLQLNVQEQIGNVMLIDIPTRMQHRDTFSESALAIDHSLGQVLQNIALVRNQYR